MSQTLSDLPSTSPSPARRRRRKEARPGEIATAALACFAERGFAATRLEEVAKRAGVTKGTLYLYFPNKEELFKAVVRQSIVPNLISNEALVEEAREPAPVVLAQLVARWSEALTKPSSALSKIVIAESGNFPDITRFYLEEVVHRGMSLFRRVLQAGVESGEFRPMDVENTVRCVVAPLVVGMLWQHSFGPIEGRPLDVDGLRDALLQLLLPGLAPNDERNGMAIAARLEEADK
jgi:AcrR family transcriptional regulator